METILPTKGCGDSGLDGNKPSMESKQILAGAIIRVTYSAAPMPELKPELKVKENYEARVQNILFKTMLSLSVLVAYSLRGLWRYVLQEWRKQRSVSRATPASQHHMTMLTLFQSFQFPSGRYSINVLCPKQEKQLIKTEFCTLFLIYPSRSI